MCNGAHNGAHAELICAAINLFTAGTTGATTETNKPVTSPTVDTEATATAATTVDSTTTNDDNISTATPAQFSTGVRGAQPSRQQPKRKVMSAGAKAKGMLSFFKVSIYLCTCLVCNVFLCFNSGSQPHVSTAAVDE
jgi:hypothetical protein